MKEVLNVVSENDEVIGHETREVIHREGLLHREIHIDFITPDRQVIFQHRAKDKDTFPDLLDATVGGHVDIGDSYLTAAIREAEEETGQRIEADDLIFVNKVKKRAIDKATGRINYAYSSRYVYIYRGDVGDLKIESGKSLGFEAWSFDKLNHLSEEEKMRFIPSILIFTTTILSDFVNNLDLS